jgi:hypothetical protein
MNVYHGSTSYPFGLEQPCQYCSNGCQQIYHGGKCPKVKSIEYHENGTVKKVEFFGDEKPKVGFNEWMPGIKSDLCYIRELNESDQATS